ncbi:MAG TPA: TIM barrel protein [Candidatus Limnocylindrales bacterium]|nr:TIM barrel protein [Candidatus Limnocylindrales bacterium]
MVLDRSISRRALLKVGAGTAAAAALSTFAGASVFAAPKAGSANGRLIPEDKVGTITFTQRDVPSRIGIAAAASLGVSPTMGFLGGPGFPEDPTDLGPLVPLPGGWRELFEYLAGIGFTQIEFAGYGQNANNPGGTAAYNASAEGRANYLAYAGRLRGFLDEFGLRAIGNHGFIPNTWFGPNSAGGTMSAADELRYLTELEFAAILGMKYMGTGNDPTSANNRNVEAWDIAGEKWEALNELSIASFDIQLYPHNHSPAYNFLQDGPMVEVTVNRVTGEPLATPQVVRGESGKRLMEYYLEITRPDLCGIELDIYWAHVAQHQHRWYYDWDGNRRELIFDVPAYISSNTKRIPLYHAKDGESTGQAPGVGNGYNFVPFGTGDIDFRHLFQTQGAKGFHNPNYEQDNAPGGSGDPGRSLRVSKLSGTNMVALRG